jgi:hypothetical protein
LVENHPAQVNNTIGFRLCFPAVPESLLLVEDMGFALTLLPVRAVPAKLPANGLGLVGFGCGSVGLISL